MKTEIPHFTVNPRFPARNLKTGAVLFFLATIAGCATTEKQQHQSAALMCDDSFKSVLANNPDTKVLLV